MEVYIVSPWIFIVTDIHYNSNITCVWYPSGGFGHFVNAVLTLHGVDFVRPESIKYQFSDDGNSHQLPLTAPKFFHNPKNYKFNFDSSKQCYSLLIDNGISDENNNFIDQFPNARVIKICYSDYSWPIVASTMIHKAMQSTLHSQLPLDPLGWDCHEDWAVREKYFLFLKEHPYRTWWKPSNRCHNIFVDALLDYQQFVQSLKDSNIDVWDFYPLWQQWISANTQYIEPVAVAHKIISAVKNNQSMNISHYRDVWTQAVVNYFIWLEYQFEVPANDYADWFSTTDQILNMIHA
jgi:hypothetical protein